MTKFIGFYLIIIGLAVNAAEKVISIRTDVWCPFACEPKAKNPGFMIEIVQDILKKEGYTVDYQLMPWARAIRDTKLGKYDAIIGAGRSDAPGFIFPDEPQGLTKYSTFGLKETNWKYLDEKSLEGIKLGAISSYSYDDETNRLIEKKHGSIELVSGDEPLGQLIKMVEQKRIMAFVESPQVLSFYLKEKNIKIKLNDLGPLKENSQELYIAFSPEKKELSGLAKKISLGTVELRKTGKLKKILSKYGLTDWKK